jgi:hypothetical protein
LTAMGLIDDLRADFDLFYLDNAAYRAKVDALSALLKLKDERRLRSDYLPTYVVGDYKSERSKYILLGMNPGFSEEHNQQEEQFKNGTWDRYDNFIAQFFVWRKQNGLGSKYYRTLSKLFAGLDGISLRSEGDAWDYFQNNLISIDLIPYHGANFGMTTRLESDQERYLSKRLATCFEFVHEMKHKLVVLNGRLFYTLLSANPSIAAGRGTKLNDKSTLYAFRYQGVPCILFRWMLTSRFSGVDRDPQTMSVTIPQFVRETFGSAPSPDSEGGLGTDEDKKQRVSQFNCFGCTTLVGEGRHPNSHTRFFPWKGFD